MELTALVPRSRSQRRRVPSLVDVTPSLEQREAILAPRERPLLVLGEAGHGKTTILVLRVAHLVREGQGRLRAAVIVPTDGLVGLLQPLLRRVGADVEVSTFDRWASVQARHSFRWLPKESELTPGNVMRLKRSPALRLALQRLAEREPGRVDDDHDAPVVRSRRRVSRGDLQHLFGDRMLMEEVARVGALPRTCVEDVLERTRVQVGPSAEREYAHVSDHSRLRAIDGRLIDDGTATAHADTVDAEDYPVLFELGRLRALARGKSATPPRAFDLIAVDEAQEFAPLELALLGRSLAPGGTLVVSGDADQQTDGTTAFLGWDAVAHELGVERLDTVALKIGFRCPPHVEALARAIRDGQPVPAALLQTTALEAETAAPPVQRGAPTTLRRFTDEASLCAELGREIERVLARDQRASLAVLCRTAVTVRRLAARFRQSAPVRLVFDGRFLPRGPAQASTVDEVKGLEFDYVIVPDADATTYPSDVASRRALYVAVTRARHQVVLAHTGAASPLLNDASARDSGIDGPTSLRDARAP
jgi:superfamily I DNA/RNA helicase